MSRYHFGMYDREGESICRLQDLDRNCVVEIATTFGMNVIRYCWQGRDLILMPPSLSTLKETPFRFGGAMLSPPGKTSNGRFVHRGITYQLPITNGAHNVHGQIGTIPWKVEQIGADEEKGAFIQASYAYKDDPDRYSYFPHELIYTLTFRLKDGILSLDGSVSNEGDYYAPFALGFHPYFNFIGSRDKVEVQILTNSEWVREQDGYARSLPEYTPRVEQLRNGIALSQLKDSLYYFECSDVDTLSTGSYICRMIDKETNLVIAFHVDALFSKMMLFIPPWGDAVSFEPHTCVPDAFNLPLAADKTGVQELAPDEVKRFGWFIHASTPETLTAKNVVEY